MSEHALKETRSTGYAQWTETLIPQRRVDRPIQREPVYEPLEHTYNRALVAILDLSTAQAYLNPAYRLTSPHAPTSSPDAQRPSWKNLKLYHVALSPKESGSHNALGTRPDRFHPSITLRNLVKEGRAFYALAAGVTNDIPVLSPPDAIDQFSTTVIELFGALATRHQSGADDYSGVSASGEFSPYYQIAFLDAFPVAPKDVAHFLARLHSELLSYLFHGGTISGDWGKLVLVRPSDLALDVAPLPKSIFGKWEKATVSDD